MFSDAVNFPICLTVHWGDCKDSEQTSCECKARKRVVIGRDLLLSQRDEVCAQAQHNNCKYDDRHCGKRRQKPMEEKLYGPTKGDETNNGRVA